MKTRSRAVNERWRLRNGSIATITIRKGHHLAAGTIDGDGSLAGVHIWDNGASAAGPEYDLVELVDQPKDPAGSNVLS